MVEFLLALVTAMAQLQTDISGGSAPKLAAPPRGLNLLPPLAAISTAAPLLVPPTTQAPMATLPPSPTRTPTAKPLPTKTPAPLATPTTARKVVNGKVYDAYIEAATKN